MAAPIDNTGFLSEGFNPLNALYAGDVELPSSDAPILDNVAQYENAAKGLVSKPKASLKSSNISDKCTGQGPQQGKTRTLPDASLADRSSKIGDQEGNVKQGESLLVRRSINKRDVLTRMEACTKGPLSVLHHCVSENKQVKVWIRSFRHVRGICTGYIVAFDKHFNLAMVDVDEVYCKPPAKRRVKSKNKKKVKLDEGVKNKEDITDTKNPILNEEDPQQTDLPEAQNSQKEQEPTENTVNDNEIMDDNTESETNKCDSQEVENNADGDNDVDDLATKLAALQHELAELSEGECTPSSESEQEGDIENEKSVQEMKVKGGPDEKSRHKGRSRRRDGHKHREKHSSSHRKTDRDRKHSEKRSKTHSSSSRDRDSRYEYSHKRSSKESGERSVRNRSPSGGRVKGKSRSKSKEKTHDNIKTNSWDDFDSELQRSHSVEEVCFKTDNARNSVGDFPVKMLKRHVNQLFIRGDNVVMVAVLE